MAKGRPRARTRTGTRAAVQDLGRGGHAPRDLDRGFAEEDETGGVIGIRLPFFHVKPGAIVKLVATDEKNLQILGGAAFEQVGGENFLG